jgi:hypothetical protein
VTWLSPFKIEIDIVSREVRRLPLSLTAYAQLQPRNRHMDESEELMASLEEAREVSKQYGLFGSVTLAHIFFSHP